MISNDLRISGLASGMDTESIVKKLMDVERSSLNKVFQQKQWQEWQRDAYRDVNAKLLDLRTSMQDLRLQSAFQKSKVQSSDSSKVEAVVAGVPSQSNYAITSATRYQAGTPSSVKFAAASVANDTTPLGAGKGTSFVLNDQTITIKDTDTIQSAIAAINSVSSTTQVTASYSAGDKSIILTSNEGSTQQNQQISISGVTVASNGLNIVNGMVDSTTSNEYRSGGSAVAGTTAHSYTAGVNGIVAINGTTLSITSNTFTFDGIRYTLNADIPAGSAVNVTKSTDIDAVYNSIKTFVDKYNDVIQSLHDKIQEKKNRDYLPLLDEQKKDMEEEDIKLWDNKAKSGLLQNDSIIGSALSKMRQALYSQVSDPDPTKVNSKFDTLAEIGITTSTNYRENGKLTIDEAKLKGLLETNASDVQALFTKTYNTGNSTDTTATSSSKFQNSGVAWRVYDQLNSSIQQLIGKAGDANGATSSSVLDKALKRLDEQIISWEDRLAQKEENYWKKFAAMEKAIQQANTQSAWLTNQLGGM